jgi:hypothetical protein
MSWEPSSYNPASFPYRNVCVIDKWRWNTTFRFKIGNHFSRQTYKFDDNTGDTYSSRCSFHFITKDRELNSKIISICNKNGFPHGLMWEGQKKGWYHVIINNHRMVHHVLRALRQANLKVFVWESKTYFVQSNK